MNGLIHPCCHDTAPLPEPESEEEMFERMFNLIDRLVMVVRPQKCLVLCIDGVAPRSKMNQQRSRRFRAATERQESNDIASTCATTIVTEYSLPKPEFRERWDHNVITPSTAFMERVGQAIEWFILKKLNEDPEWRHLTVVFSDAHVPGEGEHKIMHYIRGLRSQPGYNPNTSHCIHGMDADLICLGLASHEPNFGILRNQLNENFQPDGNKFCYFNLCKFRQHLKKDFANIKGMDFERVVDDFVFLCFFVGNDFLPHLPLVSIKTKGIELMLDHYVRNFDDHYYLTKKGEVRFDRLGAFLKSFEGQRFEDLAKEYRGKVAAKERARKHVDERIRLEQTNLQNALSSLATDRSNAQAVSNKVLGHMSTIQKEQLRFVAGREELGFSYADKKSRDTYYQKKFGWDIADPRTMETNIAQCCREYLRGMQWVMRYYTKGCPSWEWFYPYHYAPLLQDIIIYHTNVNVEMRMAAPLHPVEQLLSVLPRESVAALPEELHEAVLDPKSPLGPFYPDEVTIDISEALFAYQAVILLPFIKVGKLVKAANTIVELEPDQGTSLVYARNDTLVAKLMSNLVSDGARAAISDNVVRICPIAGRVGLYENEWPLNSSVECPDRGLAGYCKAYGQDIANNAVRIFGYDLSAHADYTGTLLPGAKEHLARVESKPPPLMNFNRPKRPREEEGNKQRPVGVQGGRPGQGGERNDYRRDDRRDDSRRDDNRRDNNRRDDNRRDDRRDDGRDDRRDEGRRDGDRARDDKDNSGRFHHRSEN
eukprot:GILI01017255.1.p1 GENE.GILI01017255.1~~GILI01017255.1.p1  ORF type:complete len:824 (+),score=135.58 GILI01017255.1:176-2473(+)